MTTPFRPSLRLKPSILGLFVLLTVPVLAVIIVVNYVSNDRIARANGQELVERFRLEAIDSVREIFDPIKSMVRVAAALGDQQGDFYTDNLMFFADVYNGNLYAATFDANRQISGIQVVDTSMPYIVDLQKGPDNWIYGVDLLSGAIRRWGDPTVPGSGSLAAPESSSPPPGPPSAAWCYSIPKRCC